MALDIATEEAGRETGGQRMKVDIKRL